MSMSARDPSTPRTGRPLVQWHTGPVSGPRRPATRGLPIFGFQGFWRGVSCSTFPPTHRLRREGWRHQFFFTYYESKGKQSFLSAVQWPSTPHPIMEHSLA